MFDLQLILNLHKNWLSNNLMQKKKKILQRLCYNQQRERVVNYSFLLYWSTTHYMLIMRWLLWHITQAASRGVLKIMIKNTPDTLFSMDFTRNSFAEYRGSFDRMKRGLNFQKFSCGMQQNLPGNLFRGRN